MATVGVAGAGRMWARAEIRRRPVALVGLGLLAGLAAAVALSSIAGARRTDDSYDRLRSTTHAADAVVFASQVGVVYPDWQPVADLPYIEAAGAFGLGSITVVRAPHGIDPATSGVFDVAFGTWRTDIDRPVLSAGRLPDPSNPHEVLATTSSNPDVRVGDRFTVQRPSDEQLDAFDIWGPPQGPTMELEVVGIGRSAFEQAIVTDDGEPGEAPTGAGLIATPAFHEQYAGRTMVVDNLLVRFKPGQADLKRLESDVRRILNKPEMPILDAVAVSKRVTNGTELEARGLLLFGLAVALAGTVLVGQALTRSVRAGADDLPALRALGFRRRDAATALALPHLVPVAAAASPPSSAPSDCRSCSPSDSDARSTPTSGSTPTGRSSSPGPLSSWGRSAPRSRSRRGGKRDAAGASVPDGTPGSHGGCATSAHRWWPPPGPNWRWSPVAGVGHSPRAPHWRVP